MPGSLPLDAISYAVNCRAVDDKLEAYNGKTDLYTPASNFYAGCIDFLISDGNTYHVVLGRGQVQVFNGVVWYDITPTSLASTPMGLNQELEWTKTKLGSIPIYNNYNYYPVYWSPQQTTQKLLPLKFDASHTWEAKNYKCKAMRAHKNFLFALNLTEGITKYPYSYRWSHPADTNGLPPSWNDADLNYVASKEQIAGSGGDIVDGMSLRDAFCIYSKNAITILDYVGDEFIFKARTLSESFGLVANNCLVEFKGIHYILSDGDILKVDGNSIESVLLNKQRRKLTATLSNTSYDNCFALAVPNKSEVWFFIVEDGYTVPNIIYMINTNTGSVYTREVSGVTSAVYGLRASVDDSWDSGPIGTWDSDTSIWDQSSYSPFASKVLGVELSNSAICSLDETTTNYNTVIERTDLVPEGISRATTVVAVYPRVTCPGNVGVQIGSQQHVNGPVTWKPLLQFNPNTDRKLCMRTTGKAHAIRFTSVGNYKFSLAGFDIEVVDAGVR